MSFPVIFLRTTTQPDWAEAACHSDQYDPDLWFTDDRVDQGEAVMAMSVCNRCPIAGDCLSYALEAGIDWGIWGGVTARQRQRIRPADPFREQRALVASVDKLIRDGMTLEGACRLLGVADHTVHRARKAIREASR